MKIKLLKKIRKRYKIIKSVSQGNIHYNVVDILNKTLETSSTSYKFVIDYIIGKTLGSNILSTIIRYNHITKKENRIKRTRYIKLIF